VTQALPDGAVFGLSAIGTTGLVLTPASTEFEVFSPEGLSGSPYDLDCSDDTRGWALVQASGGPAPKIATWQQVYIEQTDDGGHTWAPVFLPKGTPTPSP
jgi:hypothetical protein